MPQLKSCIYTFYGCINLKKIFRDTQRINSLFPYKDRLNHSLKSKLAYKASSRTVMTFILVKRRVDYMIEKFQSTLEELSNIRHCGSHYFNWTQY